MMGFERLKFTKEWTDHTAFPTVETDEAKVRADMQVLHDEAKAALNKLMDALEAVESAAKLGAVGPQGEDSTIQDELDGLHEGMIKAGALPVGGSTEQMLVKSSEENYATRWAGIGEIMKAVQAQANGVASLNEEGEIPLGQIPKELRDLIAAGLPWKLIDTIDNTRGYSGEWEAPDVFGDGSAYDIGVYALGAGESGESNVFVGEWEGSEYDYTSTAPGGASGYGQNAILRNVSPGTLLPWVVGKGGIAPTSKNGAKRVAGGTTSFGGITAPGGGSITAGEGGQPSTGKTSGTTVDYYGCVVAKNDSLYGYVTPQNPREGQNRFDPLMLTLACGFGASARVSYNSDTDEQKGYSYTETPGSDNPTQGELGLGAAKCVVNSSTTSITVTATSGTNGNGGGGAVAMHGARSSGVTVSVTAGNGGDGVIFLYARKAVAE